MSRRKSDLKQNYGLTTDDFIALCLSAGCACSICERPVELIGTDETKQNIANVDHCHQTGAIRGCLCHACNNGLEKFEDSPELLQNAIDYLLARKIPE